MVAEDGFWVSKLQDAAILDIFATMFAMSDSKVSTETLEPEEDLVKTLDDVAETFTTAEVTSAWNQGGTDFTPARPPGICSTRGGYQLAYA